MATPNFTIGEEVLFPVEDGSLLRGIILKFLRAKDSVRIEETISGSIYECPKKLVDKMVGTDVNWRFRYYEDLAKLTIFKEFKSIFVAGSGGLGKSYTVQQILESEEFIEDRDYVYVKGHVSPYALFQLLQEHCTLPFIFDDCDGILKDSTSLEILKAVIDSYSNRKVKWLTSAGVRERVSSVFEFTGSIIFLSNLPFDKVPQPIVSRTIMVDVSMTAQEKMDRMRYIVKTMPEMDGFSPEEIEELLNVLDRYKLLMADFNLRSLVKAATMYRKTGTWDYVKASIMAS